MDMLDLPFHSHSGVQWRCITGMNFFLEGFMLSLREILQHLHSDKIPQKEMFFRLYAISVRDTPVFTHQ